MAADTKAHRTNIASAPSLFFNKLNHRLIIGVVALNIFCGFICITFIATCIVVAKHSTDWIEFMENLRY